MILLIFIAAFVILGHLAVTFGHDSRDGCPNW